ncbi:uncharacterized protein LOC144106424 [Amblyomma americanum]|uniref:Uncharacterized protein n=1 Tax=Amblyomma americanum TaxID=6943 RepID=A0AAQ4EBK3_AMBAM
MKQESCEGDVLLRPRSCSSTPDSELRPEDENGYYDFPMDLRKKSPKSPDEEDEESATTARRRPIHPAALNHAWQKILLNAMPAPAVAFQHGSKRHSELSARLLDVAEEKSVPEGQQESCVIGKPCQDDKENHCACACSGKKDGGDSLLDLRKEPSKADAHARGPLMSGPYRTDKDSNPTLIRFLESRALSSQRQESDTPEDLSSRKTPPAEHHQDQGVKRAASCPKLFEITSESLVERLMRARCKSDSEIQNRLNNGSARPGGNEESSPPPSRDSPSLTLKRRILGGLATPDRARVEEVGCKHPRMRVETISKPGSRPCSPVCDQRAPQETLLQQLRQLAPAALPLSIYAYYTQIMQRLHEHELLKRHLEGMAASGVLPGPLLAPTTLVASAAPELEPPEEHDELGPAAGNNLDSYNCGMRKRAPRALTGKHVKHGTGASPSTLLTLRQKIQERQRARQLGLLEPAVRTLKGTRKGGFGKGSSNGKKLKK